MRNHLHINTAHWVVFSQLMCASQFISNCMTSLTTYTIHTVHLLKQTEEIQDLVFIQSRFVL